ncbi:hypothetical protein RUM43_001736 [Polyplax serrata]|uniref:Fibronectin type-III domain-containing protein n=1 Tax=Polyplax serrata TaxID=468196 RepID=A0AAN8XQS9_POLSC
MKSMVVCESTLVDEKEESDCCLSEKTNGEVNAENILADKSVINKSKEEIGSEENDDFLEIIVEKCVGRTFIKECDSVSKENIEDSSDLSVEALENAGRNSDAVNSEIDKSKCSVNCSLEDCTPNNVVKVDDESSKSISTTNKVENDLRASDNDKSENAPQVAEKEEKDENKEISQEKVESFDVTEKGDVNIVELDDDLSPVNSLEEHTGKKQTPESVNKENGTTKQEVGESGTETVEEGKEEKSIDDLPVVSTGVKRSSDILSRPMPKSKKLSLLHEHTQKSREEDIVPEVSATGASSTEQIEMMECDQSNSELSAVSKGLEDCLSNSSSSTDNSECKVKKRSWRRIDRTTVKETTESSVSDGTRAKRKKIREKLEDKETEKNSSNSSLYNRSNVQEADRDGKKENSNTTEEKRSSTFLSSLRGTLKSLTRGDLEELVVQKLCEVITERSTVGELRRKAQALEEDQERWRAKVAGLLKQVREMEMVMKKYMSEVQKQAKENGGQIVVPLRVTRSVGLQSTKSQKSNSQQNITTGVTSIPPTTSVSSSVQAGYSSNMKHAPPNLPRIPSQISIHPQPPQSRVKPGPSGQKANSQKPMGPCTVTKKQSCRSVEQGETAQSQRHSLPIPLHGPKSSTNVTLRPRHSGESHNKVGSATHTQQQQNGSKVIDLTDDDDKQTPSMKSTGPLRVGNNISQVPQNNTYAYILPNTTVTPAPPSIGQNLQVLLTTPVQQQNRQLMPVPPLLIKNPGTGQPVNQPSSAKRPICPKPLKHPAPLPPQPVAQYQKGNLKLLPPRPALKISKVQTGIVLSWNMSLGPEHAPISSYQLYAYQEGTAPPATSLWKKVGDVKALPLPMACTLTQFMSGHKYHFAVRAVDHHARIGPFSYPGTIVLVK